MLRNLLRARAVNGELDREIDIFGMGDAETPGELLLLPTAPTADVPVFGEAQTPRLFDAYLRRLRAQTLAGVDGLEARDGREAAPTYARPNA
eukprot:4578718-Pleurochrysis_carterae.AAC.1